MAKNNGKDPEANAVEEGVSDLKAEMGEWGVAASVDPKDADLEMSPAFEERVWASRRMILVRDANLTHLNMIGNRTINPGVASEREKEFNALRWQIAAIDLRYPSAKKISQEMMELIAMQEKAGDDRIRQGAGVTS